MKKLYFALAAITLAASFGILALRAGNQNDLPVQKMKELEKAKEDARAKHDSWAFYNAWNDYIRVAVSRNWKLRESLVQTREKEFESFGSPILMYVTSGLRQTTNGKEEFILGNEAVLSKERNEGFYEHFQPRGMDSRMVFCIENDLEYCLWENRSFDKLEKLLNGRYPAAGYLSYLRTLELDGREKEDSLMALATRYAGSALSLWPRMSLLLEKKRVLDISKASEEEYKALRSEAENFELTRKKLQGNDAKIAKGCTGIKGLIMSLDEKALNTYRSKDSLFIVMKNLPWAKATVSKSVKKSDKAWKDEVLWEYKAWSKTDRYYLADTVGVKLPALEDGNFTIRVENGKTASEADFSHKSIVLSLRKDKDGWGVYAADAESGEPLEEVNLRLGRDDEDVLSTTGFKLSKGFTTLPESYQTIPGFCYLTCSYTDRDGLPRESEAIRFGGHESEEREITYRGNIFLDRSIYAPGDTVHFKAIIYTSEFKLFGKDETVYTELFDASGKSVKKIISRTSDFGSIAGSFILPKDRDNGTFSISVSDGSRTFGSASFQVSEFDLPTFALELEEQKTPTIPGDTIVVKGAVKSYSGLSTSGAAIGYTLISRGSIVYSGETAPDVTGEFCLLIPTQKGMDDAFAKVDVKAVLPTGEVANSSQRVSVHLGRIHIHHNILNCSDDIMVLPDDAGYSSTSVIRSKNLEFILSARDMEYRIVSADISWHLSKAGTVLHEGSASGSATTRIDNLENGLYRLDYSCKVDRVSSNARSEGYTYILMADDESALPLKEIDHCILWGDKIASGSQTCGCRIATGAKPMWAVSELHDSKGTLLSKNFFKIGAGETSSFDFLYEKSWSDNVSLSVLFVRDGVGHLFHKSFSKAKPQESLPLFFERFTEKVGPGSTVNLRIRTNPGAECLAAVFDKGGDSLRPNKWERIEREIEPLAPVYYNYTRGGFFDFYPRYYLHKSIAVQNGLAEAYDNVEYENVMVRGYVTDRPSDAVRIRQVFKKSLAFEPFLHPDDSGRINLRFKASDKLSTYVVSLFAHDKNLNNNTIRKDLVITLPVQTAVNEPKYLYEGDSCSVDVVVSSSLDKEISGKVLFTSSEERVEDVSIPAGSSVKLSFPVVAKNGEEELSLKIMFIPESQEYSDGIEVKVPIKAAVQTITESHSAFLKPGCDRDSLAREIGKSFVNLPASGALYSEKSILDILKDAVNGSADPSSDNAISIAESYYARKIAGQAGVQVRSEVSEQELLKKLSECLNADGGYSWFAGMPSSPAVTAALLEWASRTDGMGMNTAGAIAYLDKQQFSKGNRPLWRGGLTLERYLSVRFMFPGIPFKEEAPDSFAKTAKKYLSAKSVIHDGRILSRARRTLILESMLSGKDAADLAGKLGIRQPSYRIRKTIESDIASLIEYAVEHQHGGWYFPNAVMPFRGLMESEAYAHSILCDLLEKHSEGNSRCREISDGIRLWLMVQKETQNWTPESGFIDALHSISKGISRIGDFRILILSKSMVLPFSSVKPSGNGMTVEKRMSDDGKALCIIRNEENRSFVKVTVPREAGLTPIEKFSGFDYRLGAYRNVKIDRTEYYFDSFPEGDSRIIELLTPTQKGYFQSPAITVESLYAPHYRANSAASTENLD